jgi:two-component system, NarL family, invasion response regulator UvrY
MDRGDEVAATSPDPGDDCSAANTDTRGLRLFAVTLEHRSSTPMPAPLAPTAGPIRVLTADDHPGFLATARDLVRATPGFEIVAEATSGERAVALTARLHPDLVLLDVHMPGIGGIEAARRIVAECPETVLVLISAYAVEDLPVDARHCGARAVLSKQQLRPRTITRLWSLAGTTPPGSLLTGVES